MDGLGRLGSTLAHLFLHSLNGLFHGPTRGLLLRIGLNGADGDTHTCRPRVLDVY